MASLAVLILSFDGYSDLWDNFFKAFFANWQDCPFNVYLLSNKKEYPDPRVTTIKTEENGSWAWMARRAVEQIPEDYILIFNDDYYLLDKVDTSLIKQHFDFVIEHGIDSLNLHVSGGKKTEFAQYKEVVYSQPYCITYAFHIMKKDLFYSLCKDDYSPWDFENKNSFEAFDKKQMPGVFYSVKKKAIPAWYEGVLVKGKWTRKAYKHFSRLGYDIDLSKHPLMSRGEAFKQRTREIISDLIPPKMLAKLKRSIQGKNK